MTAVAETRPSVGTSKKSSFRPDIQGLRAIAVLLVVLYHSGAEWLSGGYVGVDVFFVISGFLITTHLLESLERHGRVRFGSFYAKRARRILPASLLVAILTVLAAWLWMPPLLMREVMVGAVAAALYVPNLLFAVQGTNYLAETAPSVFQHYWSLGIEEQFYVFWPAILAFGFWACRRHERRLFVLVAVLTVASFALCLVGMGLSQPWTFFSLPTRAWELGVGGLVAFLMRSRSQWLKAPSVGLLAWVGLVLLFGAGVVFDPSTPFPGYYAALPVLATALLIVGGAAPGELHANKLLSLRPFQQVGAISYSLYLVHWPLQIIPQAVAGVDTSLPLWVRIFLGAAAFPLAWLLYRFVERPAMSWPALKDRKPIWSGVAAVAASLAVILVAGGAYLGSSRSVLATDRVAATTAVEISPAGTAYVPANLTPTLRGATDDNPVIYSNGCHRHFDSTDASGCQVSENPDAPVVFLFGDSHAASWYPAFEELALQGHIRLDVNTKSSCHSVDVPQLLDGVAYTECAQWRQAVIDRINSQQPDLVVIANFANENSPLVGGNENLGPRWQQGVESTIGAISGPDVVVLADVPNQGSTPSVCLSANLEDANACAVTVSEAFSPVIRTAEESAVRTTGATPVDLTAYFCNDSVCPPIIGDTLVYRDGHHLTEGFSRQMAPPLWDELSELLD